MSDEKKKPTVIAKINRRTHDTRYTRRFDFTNGPVFLVKAMLDEHNKPILEVRLTGLGKSNSTQLQIEPNCANVITIRAKERE